MKGNSNGRRGYTALSEAGNSSSTTNNRASIVPDQVVVVTRSSGANDDSNNNHEAFPLVETPPRSRTSSSLGTTPPVSNPLASSSHSRPQSVKGFTFLIGEGDSHSDDDPFADDNEYDSEGSDTDLLRNASTKQITPSLLEQGIAFPSSRRRQQSQASSVKRKKKRYPSSLPMDSAIAKYLPSTNTSSAPSPYVDDDAKDHSSSHAQDQHRQPTGQSLKRQMTAPSIIHTTSPMNTGYVDPEITLCPVANRAGVFLPRMDVLPTSIFPPTDCLVTPIAGFSNPLPPVTPVHTDQFLEIVNEVRLAIAEGVYPTRIVQGSSGSYFCRDRSGRIVGVFKPKNEEPYGKLNPKWTKWLHKNLFPCCFGRSCLIPNLGYISEAAASYIDRRLGLNLVPRTEIVELASPTFYYSAKDRKAAKKGKAPLPPKIGSFQLFLHGFKDATAVFREGYDKMAAMPQTRVNGMESSTNSPRRPLRPDSQETSHQHPMGWTDKGQKEFQWGFERLVILDYLIRNTDRSMDNWMVKLDASDKVDNNGSSSSSSNQKTHRPSKSEEEEHDLIDMRSRTATMTSTEASTQFSSTKSHDPEHDNTRTISGIHHHHEDRTGFDAPDPEVHVAAIDNGLAFPYKHPDRWRSYPYGWAFLPISRIAFSPETRNLVLPLLTSNEWWQQTFEVLETVFRVDEGFDNSMWKRQKAVIRGQGYNLVEVLRRAELAEMDRRSASPIRGAGINGGDTSPTDSVAAAHVIEGSPWALVRRPVVAVFEEVIEEETDGDYHTPRTPSIRSDLERGVRKMKKRVRKVRQRFENFARQPWFSWC